MPPYLNNQPMAKADVAHLGNMKNVKNCGLSSVVNTHLPILILCSVPPLEMVAHMLKVSEGWLPTKPRLIGADRQSQHMPKAQFSVWQSLFLSFSFYSLTRLNAPSPPCTQH